MTSMASLSSKRIVLVSGGSGGHVMPLNAMASYLRAQGGSVYGVIDPRGAHFLKNNDFSDLLITSSLGSLTQPLSTLHHMVKTLRECHKFFRHIKPNLVWGFGARATLIPLGVAKAMGIPYGVHNADTVMGKANKFLSWGASALSLGLPFSPLPQGATLTGYPLRPGFQRYPYPPLQPFHISILGGSQGARFWHTVVPEALSLALKLLDNPEFSIRITHQCPSAFLDEAHAAYTSYGLKVTLTPFIDSMADILGQSHAVLTRAGAGTLSELMAVGRPAFLVPYPYSSQDHQVHNAKLIEARGGGWCYPQHQITAPLLAQVIHNWIMHPSLLPTAAQAMAAIYPQEQACHTLWNLMQQVILTSEVTP